jgi:hypothetical protein
MLASLADVHRRQMDRMSSRELILGLPRESPEERDAALGLADLPPWRHGWPKP